MTCHSWTGHNHGAWPLHEFKSPSETHHNPTRKYLDEDPSVWEIHKVHAELFIGSIRRVGVRENRGDVSKRIVERSDLRDREPACRPSAAPSSCGVTCRRAPTVE
jgi:hypothetical protein